MEDPTKYKQEITKMKEYKEEIKYVRDTQTNSIEWLYFYRKKERDILFIKLNLKNWEGP